MVNRRTIDVVGLLLVMVLCTLVGTAQPRYDSTYVESYRGYLMPRFLLTRKTTGLVYHNSAAGYSLRYRPNKTFNVGAGITYKFLSLRLSMGILEPEELRGKTRDLDIQFQSYGKKFALDILTQFYKGFYLPDRRFGIASQEFYVRPDLAVSAIGGSLQFISNHRRFSYRAAFQQTEWQKKSAGTLLVGMELFMGRFRADSTIVPAELQRQETDGLRKIRFIEFGPNIGYAYTWVYKKFFIYSGASVGINAGLNRLFDEKKAATFTGVSPNTIIKISSGYNVKRWGINVVYISTALRLPKFEYRSVVFNTGNLRMNFIYRIYPDKRTKKMLRQLDKVDKYLKPEPDKDINISE